MEKIKFLIVLLIAVTLNGQLQAQDQTCFDSTATLGIIFPSGLKLDVLNTVTDYFSDNGYSRNDNRFEFPDSECFILMENNNQINLHIYLPENDLSNAEQLMRSITNELNQEFDLNTPGRRGVGIIQSIAIQRTL
jgi:hypothetical protein